MNIQDCVQSPTRECIIEKEKGEICPGTDICFQFTGAQLTDPCPGPDDCRQLTGMAVPAHLAYLAKHPPKAYSLDSMFSACSCKAEPQKDEICLDTESKDDSCPGPDICEKLVAGLPPPYKRKVVECLDPDQDEICPGPEICEKLVAGQPIFRDSCTSIRVSISSDERSKLDTKHFLSPVSGRSLGTVRYRGRYCQCSAETCVCDEQESIRYSEPISSELEFRDLQRTLAIIKPDAVPYEDVVIRKIILEGFQILSKKKIHLTPEQASEFFSAHYGKLYFPYYVVSMSEAPIIVMCLAASDGVRRWRDVIGSNSTLKKRWFFPRSMRHRFGVHADEDNLLYASPDLVTANRDVRFFFPQMIIEPLLCEESEVTDFLNLYVNPTLSKGLAEAVKKKPMEPLIFLGEWLLDNNPYQPSMVPEIARLPT